MCGAFWNCIAEEPFKGMMDMTDKEFFYRRKIAEFGQKTPFRTGRGGSTVVPVVALSICERSEKEWIVRLLGVWRQG
jgi:hypothetical protein